MSSFKAKIVPNLENNYNAFLHTNIADQNADFPPLMRRVVSGSGGVKDHIYRMVIVEGCFTMARSSSLGANCSLVDTKV